MSRDPYTFGAPLVPFREPAGGWYPRLIAERDGPEAAEAALRDLEALHEECERRTVWWPDP